MRSWSNNLVMVKSYSHVFLGHITFYFTPISSVEAIILPFSYNLYSDTVLQLRGHNKWIEFNKKNRPFSEHKK